MQTSNSLICIKLGLGEGPYMLASYGQSGLVLGANMTSRSIFSLPRNRIHSDLFFTFMITPGLFKEKVSCKYNLNWKIRILLTLIFLFIYIVFKLILK